MDCKRINFYTFFCEDCLGSPHHGDQHDQETSLITAMIKVYLFVTLISTGLFRLIVSCAVLYFFKLDNASAFLLAIIFIEGIYCAIAISMVLTINVDEKLKPERIILSFVFGIIDTIGLTIALVLPLTQLIPDVTDTTVYLQYQYDVSDTLDILQYQEDVADLLTIGLYIRIALDATYILGIPLVYGLYLCSDCIFYTCKNWWKNKNPQ